MMGVNSLPKTVTRQRRGWVQHANHSATEPPNVVLLVYLLSCIFIAVYDCFMLIGDFHSAKNLHFRNAKR